jgi:hypothetical protein
MRPPCPKCGSTRHRKTDSEASFQVLASRRCRDCGHTWEPPAPRWLLKVGLVVGLVWVSLGAFVSFGPIWDGGKVDFRYLWVCGVGIGAIAECGRRLMRNREARPVPPDPGPFGRDHDT